MINAYEGIPGNGKPFPEGFMIIEEIEWSKKKNPVSPYFVEVPDTLKSVSFIGHEWMGYAQFLYDAASGTFKHFGNDSSFGKTVCYQCHTLVTARDFISRATPEGKRIVAVSAFQEWLKIHRRIYGNDKSRNSTNESSPDS